MSTSTVPLALDFPHTWDASILRTAPLIAPARQFTYPQQIAGEEDALARGALLVDVKPATGGSFLATCALGFTDPNMPSGLYACPCPDELCAVAGGYAYVIDTAHPGHSKLLPMKPVAEVFPAPRNNLLLFVGFHTILAWGTDGQAWETGRLSWEGVRLGSLEGHTLHGFGWNLMTDREDAFTVDLRTGQHQGGAFPPNSVPSHRPA